MSIETCKLTTDEHIIHFSSIQQNSYIRIDVDRQITENDVFIIREDKVKNHLSTCDYLTVVNQDLEIQHSAMFNCQYSGSYIKILMINNSMSLKRVDIF